MITIVVDGVVSEITQEEFDTLVGVEDLNEVFLKKKEDLRRIVSANADAKMYGGFFHAGHTWDSNTKSLDLLNGAYAAFVIGSVPLPAGFFWTSADDVDVPMTVAELGALAEAAINHVNISHGMARAKKLELNNTTIANIDQFDPSI